MSYSLLSGLDNISAQSGLRRNYDFLRNTHLTYDLEIPESIVRQRPGDNTIDLVEMVTYMSTVVKATRVLVRDVFSNNDGDDISLDVSEYNSFGKKIKARTYNTIRSYIRRVGISTLKNTLKRFLNYGDAFVEMIYDFDRQNKPIFKGWLVLPTFQMFRMEDDYGNLYQYEQRKSLYKDSDVIKFSPSSICHFRYDLEYLYGRSIYYPCTVEWDGYKTGLLALKEALKIAHNPIKKTFSENIPIPKIKEHIQQEQDRFAISGIPTVIYDGYDGISIERLQGNSNLKDIIETLEWHKQNIKDLSGLPLWMFADQTMKSAREVSAQPALAYSRYINSIRSEFCEGMRSAIDTHLILNGIDELDYMFKWPKFYIDVNSYSDIKNDNLLDDIKNLGDLDNAPE